MSPGDEHRTDMSGLSPHRPDNRSVVVFGQPENGRYRLAEKRPFGAPVKLGPGRRAPGRAGQDTDVMFFPAGNRVETSRAAKGACQSPVPA